MPLDVNSMFYGLELTEEQRIYADSIHDNRMTIANAKAGTGKTTIAVGCAKILKRDLYYVFSPVEEGKMGFRPGKQYEKELDYTQPLKDALLEINEDPARVIDSPENIENIKNGNVWVYPRSHIFMRGTNLKDAFIIIDEAQNWTKAELKKMLTRIHDSNIVVVIGHDGQIDLKVPSMSGFTYLIEHFATRPWCKVCELTKNFRGELSKWADEMEV
jgi:PhoH-like ATPase